jgi:hypothetical protein
MGAAAWVAKKWWRRLTVVVCGVVHEHRHRPDPLSGHGDGALQRGDVAHVAVLVERRRVARGGELGCQRRTGVVLHVDEADPHALAGELADEFRAQSGGAAADEGDLAAQARVDGELLGHGTTIARPTASRCRTPRADARRRAPSDPGQARRASRRASSTRWRGGQ